MDMSALSGQITVYPRPLGTDLFVCLLDIATFCMLAYKLTVSRLAADSLAYRAAWGVVAIGSLWQSTVSFCRIVGYRLPDILWSGWSLQDVGIFAIVLLTLRRPRLRATRPYQPRAKQRGTQ